MAIRATPYGYAGGIKTLEILVGKPGLKQQCPRRGADGEGRPSMGVCVEGTNDEGGDRGVEGGGEESREAMAQIGDVIVN
jgi:hypothetical protein